MARREVALRVAAPLLVLLLLVGSAPRGVRGRPEEGPAAPSTPTAPTTAKSDEIGENKFGDDCKESIECGVENGFCDSDKGTCQCLPGFSVTNHIDKCGKKATVNESCSFHEQCESENVQTECRDGRCTCRFEKMPVFNADGTVDCAAVKEERPSLQTVDPAMIGVLVGLALMFIILCVVLRLFSKARWRENRTIFNTPNPRLMNVSLLKDSKLLHGAGERRASRGSIRAPSRQPSMASLRPQSPAGASLAGKVGPRRNPLATTRLPLRTHWAGGGSRRGSKTSNASPTSPKSPSSPNASSPPGSARTNGEAAGGASGSGNVIVEVRDPNV